MEFGETHIKLRRIVDRSSEARCPKCNGIVKVPSDEAGDICIHCKSNLSFIYEYVEIVTTEVEEPTEDGATRIYYREEPADGRRMSCPKCGAQCPSKAPSIEENGHQCGNCNSLIKWRTYTDQVFAATVYES